MKLKYLILVPLLTLSSCQLMPDINSESTSDKSSYSYNESPSSEKSSSKTSDSSSSQTSYSSQSSQIDEEFFTTNFDIEAKDGEYKIEIDTSTIRTKYLTGDFGTYQVYTSNGYANFEYYRATNKNNALVLLPYQANENDGTIPGSLYNYNPISNITRIQITYQLEQGSTDSFNLKLSSDNLNYSTYVAPLNYNQTTIQANINNRGEYLRLETISNQLYIYSLTIFYKGEIRNNRKTHQDNNQIRINPTQKETNLVAGVTKKSLPTKIRQAGNKYEVIETKTYTYYDLDYATNHPSEIDEIALIEPMDIINYYLAFESNPVNFASKVNNVSSIFGNKARQVSTYSRTDGYVNSVPTNKNNLSYGEYDIALDNTYPSSRGVARVVIFYNGFNANGYDDRPVGVYTDDHYYTFQEYNNAGSFLPRFNAQGNYTSYIYSAPTTLG